MFPQILLTELKLYKNMQVYDNIGACMDGRKLVLTDSLDEPSGSNFEDA